MKTAKGELKINCCYTSGAAVVQTKRAYPLYLYKQIGAARSLNLCSFGTDCKLYATVHFIDSNSLTNVTKF